MQANWRTSVIGAVLALAAGAVEMPQIVSHRGESQDRPENTMAAFRLAFERGVDGVECDVYATTDGVPVIIHDSTTGRTAGSGTNLTVTASSWDDLKDVRVGAFGSWIGTEWEGETLPKFEDYLALLASNETTKCVVELKGNGANGLVDAVVAAIQAQPLATKERVVFIAFNTSVVSAVRTALPDYDAWLLLGSGTYTGADLISRIQACNATGVDILHSATYTAEDIVAVKAAGYAFVVWTPDSDATAFALAQMGVEGITTNRGGAMKTALAALIAEANSWEEVYDSSLPAGAMSLDVGMYVTNGLVAHFDGIRNAGAALPHDPTAATWRNLAAGCTTATRKSLSSSVPAHAVAGSWTNGAAYHFGGKEYFETDDAIVLGTKVTVEVACDFDPAEQLKSQGDDVSWPSPFGASANDKDDFNLYSNMGATYGAGTWIFMKVYRGDNRNAPGWGGRYINAIYDGDNARLSVTNATAPAWQTSTKNGAISTYSTAFAIGGAGKTDGHKAKRMFVGDIYSVRVYDRILTDEEQEWNRWLDDRRFRTPDASINVVVESNVSGVEGTEANGPYLVNGHHVFSASAYTASDGNEWEPTGYKLEKWTPEKGKWDLVGEYESASFAYTNCTARPKVRLTWNWRLANGVKKYDADSYVQAGLLLNFDGIRNVGLCAPHATNASTWVNLGAMSCGATRAVVVADRPGAWTSDGYDFAAGDCFVTDVAVPFTNQVTVQLVADYDATAQTNNWPSPFGASYNADVFGLYTYTPYTGSGNDRRGDRLMFRADPINGASRGLQPWNGRIANSIVDYNRASHTGDASQSWWNGTFVAPPASYRYCIGTAWSSAANRTKRMFKGRIHAIRVYDRVLTVAELRRNKEIDYVRFYGTAGLSTETDLVEVRSEVPGIALEDEGGWLVRGTGSKTFAAPATTNIGHCTYACAGYRLETWNATKRMWENPVLMAELCSATITGTTSQPNRRITWLWTLTAGLRAAADYDVSDYVQQGLVAHYDGTRNCGARNAHSMRSIFWRDLSYRVDDMIAASNTSFEAWIEKGHHFTAAEESSFRMQDNISLGQTCTVEAAMDVDCSAQTTEFPFYFGFGYADYCMFTRKKGNSLEIKCDNWLGTPRLILTDWEGKYLANVVTPTDHYLTQGTSLSEGVQSARSNFLDIPDGKMLIAAATTYNKVDDRRKRCMTGDYYSLRIYNRALTDAEIAQNRKVDEIRYRDGFTNYVDVVVVNEQPVGVGEMVQSSVADGEYEMTGSSWTFTAAPVSVDGAMYLPQYTLETLVGGEWVKTASEWSESCTVTKGAAPTRLTWRWKRQTGLVISIR